MRKSFTQLFSIFILSMVMTLQAFAVDGMAGLVLSPDVDGYTNLETSATFVVTAPEAVVTGVGVVRLVDVTNGNVALKTFQASSANVTIAQEANDADLFEITVDFSSYLEEENVYQLEFDADFVRAADDAEASGSLTITNVTVGDYTAPKLVDTNFFDPKTGESKDVQLDNNLTVTFDEDVKVAEGGEVYIYTDNGTANGDLYEIVKDAALIVVDNVLTIDPTRDFEPETKYYVTIPEGAIVDSQAGEDAPFNGEIYENNNAFAGWLNHDGWYFTTRDNTAPVFSNVVADNVAKDKFDVFFNLNEKGEAFFLAVENGDPAPVKADFIAGNGMENIVVDDATKTFKVTVTQAFNGTGAVAVQESWAYDIYAYAENTQSPVNSGEVKKVLTKVLTLDVTAPIIDVSDSWPMHNSTVLAEDPADLDHLDADTLRIDIDGGKYEEVVAGAGELEIWKYDAGLNHVKVFSIAATDEAILFQQTGPKDEVWVPVDYAYESGVKYFVKFPKGFIKDNSGNEAEGLLSNDDWVFTIKDFIKPTYTFALDQTNLKETSGEFTITLDFTEDIYTAAPAAITEANIGTYVTIKVKDGDSWNSVTPDDIAFDGAKDQYVFTVNYDNANTESEGEYKVVVDGENIYDGAANAGTDGEDTFTLKDFAAPTASLAKMELNATDNIVIKWSEEVFNADGSAVTDADVENMVIFRKGADATGALVTATYTVSEDGKSFIIDPANDFDEVGATYYVKVGAGAVEDSEGNELATAFQANPTVADFVAPTVTFTSDGNEIVEGTLVDSDLDVVIVFAEVVERKDGGAVTMGTSAADLLNFNEEGANVTYTAEWTVAGKEITVAATSFDPNKTYTISIGKSIVDAAGNEFVNKGVEFTTLATDAPALASSTPKHEATAVGAEDPIHVVFDREIALNDGSGITVMEAGSPVVEAGIEVINGNTLVIPHADFSASELPVVVTIPADAVYSKGTTIGNAEITITFTTFDNVEPSVDTYVPAMAATEVAIDTKLKLTFDEIVEIGTGTAVVRNFATDLAVQTLNEADLKREADKMTITFTLKADLDFSTKYYVEVSNTLITDDEGNAYGGITGSAWNFTTDEDVAFAVKTTDPANEDDMVGLTDNFVITFTQPVKAGTASASETILLEVSDKDAGVYTEVFNDAANQSNYTYSGSTLTIDPVDPLVADKDYRLTIHEAIVKDVYDRPLSGGDKVVNFYTYDKYAPKYTATPKDAAKDVDIDTDIVIAWNEAPINPATGNVYTASEIKDGSIVSIDNGVLNNYVVTISGNTWTIDPDNSLEDLTDYTVSVKLTVIEDELGNAHGADDSFTFTTEDNTKPEVVATVDNITGTAAKLNITLDEKATAYYMVLEASAAAPSVPTLIADGKEASFDAAGSKAVDIKDLTSSVEYTAYVVAVDKSSNANQGIRVDVDFETLDVIKPIATVKAPAKGATAVDADADLVLTFNEEVTATNGAVILIRDVETDVVRETIVIGANTTVAKVDNVWTATVERAETLLSNTEYYVEVVEGAFVDVAAAPNAMAAINLVDGWSFTIKDTDAPMVVADGYMPKLTGTPEIEAGTALTLKFNEMVQKGTSAAITVYYAVGGAEFEVINVNDLVFGTDSTVTINMENVPAEQAEFYVQIPAGVIKDMAGNAYAGIAGTDWDFVILDETAPEVETFKFVSGVKTVSLVAENDVPIDNSIEISFTEDIFKAPDATAFTDESVADVIVLKDAAGNVIEVNTYVNDSDDPGTDVDQILVEPKEDLTSETDYILTISPVVDNKENVSEETTISFTTEDNTAPVVTFDPVAESIQVDASGVVTITFDEPVYDDVVTTTEGNKYGVPVLDENVIDLVTYVVSNNDGTVNGDAIEFTGTMSADNMVMTITPSVELASETWYKVTLKDNSVVDYSENSNTLSSTYFQLEDIVVPEVEVYTPMGGTEADGKMSIQFNEAIALGTGSLYIRDYEDGTLVEAIEVNETNVTIAQGDDDDVLDYVEIAHADLPADMDFYVTADEGAFTDVAGNKWVGIAAAEIDEWTFSTADGVKPELFGADALFPANEATNVALNENLMITFNKEIKVNTGDDYYIVIYNEDWTPFQQIPVNGGNVSLKPLTDPVYQANRIAEVTHNEFAANSTYYVRIEEGAFEDTADPANQFDGLLGMTWMFSTEDDAAPMIVWDEITPLDDATGVDASADIVITFDRSVLANAAGMVYIYEEVGTEGVLVESIDPTDIAKVMIDGRVVTVNPENNLEFNKNYYIIITEGAFTNTASNKLPFAGVITTQEWNFTTGDDMAAPVVVELSPDEETLEDNHPVFIMTFDENVQLTETGGSIFVTLAGEETAVLDIPLTADMIVDNVITIEYEYDAETGGLDKNADYFVTVDADAIQDMTGNVFAGISDAAEWTFTTGADFATGVEDPVDGSLEFKVYPNPFDSYVTVENADKLSRVIITNVAGQRVKEIVNPTETIQTGDLRSGLYIITLVTKDDVVAKTERIVKR
ncbi:Ig-like domain-containing protein [Sunxiuqinia elliptica]